MKADFEKGTKVCSRCGRELPISEFTKEKNKISIILAFPHFILHANKLVNIYPGKNVI